MTESQVTASPDTVNPPSPFDTYFEDPYLTHQWHAVFPSSHLETDAVKETMVMGEPLVLWRDSRGEVHAWRDLCIHRGAKLSLGWVKEDCLVCPYHAWSYDGTGRCVKIPAHPEIAIPGKARAATYHACEHVGYVWVCLGEPQGDPPPARHFHDERFRNVLAGPYEFNAVATRAMENFFDVAHLGIVHDGILGQADHATIEKYEVLEDPAKGLHVPNVKVFQPGTFAGHEGRYVHFDYFVSRPTTVQLENSGMGQVDAPGYSVWFTVTPIDRHRSRGWMWLIHNIPGMDDKVIVEQEDVILSQDIPIVESQHPELLPLDLREELHLMSDKAAIAYRKWLRDLGLEYGTA